MNETSSLQLMPALWLSESHVTSMGGRHMHAGRKDFGCSPTHGRGSRRRHPQTAKDFVSIDLHFLIALTFSVEVNRLLS